MFESLTAAPPDAILGLAEAFRNDPNPSRINLTVGVFQDEEGRTPILETVRAAEQRLLQTENSKGYLPIDGDREYCDLAAALYFGADHEVITSQRSATAQTPGGTGALRVAADFLHSSFPGVGVWCSSPTWPNHPKIFQAAGMKVGSYPYFDPSTHSADIDAMLQAIGSMPSGDVICLHACCHNPTGADPSASDWARIAEAVYARGLMPLLDFAYLGFGDGIAEDAVSLREFARPGCEFLMAASFSKNFGLYRERIGALTVVTGGADTAKIVASQVKTAIRTNYSNPPSHGSSIIRTILADAALRQQWEQELAAMRERINGTREQFVKKLAARIPGHDFSHIARQRGMFSYSGLSAEQVDRLRSEHGVYAVRDGRINVAGIRASNMDVLCEAIAAVVG